jgi:phosphoglycolate phosphatase-like HAD superfamily hydrolase
VEPDRAVMVGDTVYDVRAASAAGVACIGVLVGGIGELELREAGAAAVYGNVAELLADLDASPVGALLKD